MTALQKALTLRPLDPADADQLYHLDSDAEVMRWINGGEAIERQLFNDKVLPVYLHRETDPFGFFAIELSSDFAGWVSLRSDELEAVLGYRIVRNFWGQGIASTAAKLLIDRAWQHSSIERILATTYQENIGSQRVLEKLGFRLRKRFRMSAEALDAHDTSVTNGTLWSGDDLEFVIERG